MRLLDTLIVAWSNYGKSPEYGCCIRFINIINGGNLATSRVLGQKNGQGSCIHYTSKKAVEFTDNTPWIVETTFHGIFCFIRGSPKFQNLQLPETIARTSTKND